MCQSEGFSVRRCNLKSVNMDTGVTQAGSKSCETPLNATELRMRKEEEAHASQAAAEQISAGAAVVGVSSKLEGFLSLNQKQRRTLEAFCFAEMMFSLYSPLLLAGV